MPTARRYAHRPAARLIANPFETAEEAWFWFARCQALRREGARFEADRSRVERPCDPDDIARVLSALVRAKRLSRVHVRVLGRYGLLNRPPDPRDRTEERDAAHWAMALDRMTTPLIAKGLVHMHRPDTPATPADGRLLHWGAAR